MSWFQLPPLSPSQRRGQHFEQLALQHLRQHGLRLFSQNYRCRGGELDLVMLDKQALVFVEVRYRQRADFGSGLASVSRAKQRRLIHAAQHFLLHHAEHASAVCRFDVVGVSIISNTPRFDWVRNAFDCNPV